MSAIRPLKVIGFGSETLSKNIKVHGNERFCICEDILDDILNFISQIAHG